MKNFPGGWNALENMNPSLITTYISTVKATFGAPVNADVLWSNNYNTPTGGTWGASPITINDEPTVVAVNGMHNGQELIYSQAMNSQTKMANLSSDVPSQLKGLVFLYNNPTSPRFLSKLSLNLGGLNYNSIQISVMENSVTNGNEHGEIQVFNFGTGPFTGVGTFEFLFSGYTGQVNLGIRLESTTNVSSIFELRCFLIQP